MLQEVNLLHTVFYVNGTLRVTDLTISEYSIVTDCDSVYNWFVVVSNNCAADTSETWEFSTVRSPSAPVLISISDGLEDVPAGDATLLWHSSTGSTPLTYTVFVNGIEYASAISDTFVDINLICDEVYHWSVTATNYCGSVSSTVWSFSTSLSPTIPALIEPYDMSYVPFGTVEAIWHSSFGSEPITYNFYINGILIEAGIPDTVVPVNTFCDSVYSWRVEAVNSCGVVSSDEWVFRGPACGLPDATLIEPLPDTWSSCG
jgi:hypothetical protein